MALGCRRHAPLCLLCLAAITRLSASTAALAQTSEPSAAPTVMNTATATTAADKRTAPPDGSAPSGADTPLIATLALDRTHARVNEQVLLTLDVGVPDSAFALTGDTPAVEGARLVSLTRRESVRSIDGAPYRFTRSVYALFADQPGTLEIPPLAFRATLPVSAGGAGSVRNPRISASTEALRVGIGAPPDTSVAWLPARSVTLSNAERGATDDAPREVRAGEPFTREVRIDARGQQPAAIPPLAIAPVDGLRVYPQPARLDSRIAPDGLHGSRTESSVIVAGKSGPALLPAVTLDWWNIDERAWHTAKLPAERILVVPGLTAAPDWRQERRRYRLALAVSATLSAILATASIMLWRRRGAPAAHSRNATPSSGVLSERDAWSVLRRALRRGDARSVRAALSRWRRSHRPGTCTLLRSEDPALDAALRRLDDHLYGTDASAEPDLPALHTALVRARRRTRTRRAERATDVRLYPDERTDSDGARGP